MTGHVRADRQNETCFSLGFLLEGKTAASLLLCMSHLCKWDPQRATPTQTAETTCSFIRLLEHMQGEATWSHLLFDSWQIMNRLAKQQSCLLSTPLVHVGWMLFAVNKKGNQSFIIKFVFSSLEIFGSVLMMTCFWLPGYKFSFRKSDCSTITASTDQGQFSFTHSFFFKWKLWFTLLIAEVAFEKIQAYTLQLCVFSTDDFHKYFLHSLSCLHTFLFHFGATLRLLLGLKMPQ